MAIYTETFDGTTLNATWWTTTNPLGATLSNSTTYLYLEDISISQAYTLTSKSRFHGSVSAEMKFNFDNASAYGPTLRFIIAKGTYPEAYITLFVDDGTLVAYTTAQAGLASTTIPSYQATTFYWLKITQNANDSISFYYKADGGSYTLIGTSNPYPTLFDGEHVNTYCRLAAQTTNRPIANKIRIDTYIVESTFSDVLGLWPIEMKCTSDILFSQFLTGYSLPAEEPAFSFIEEFDETYKPGDYYATYTLDPPVDGVFRFHEDDPSLTFSTKSQVLYSTKKLANKAGQRLSIVYKMDLKVLGGTSVLNFMAYIDTNNSVSFLIARFSTTGLGRAQLIARQGGAQSTISPVETNILLNTTIYIWIKEISDTSIQFLYRYEDSDWMLVGTTTARNPFSVAPRIPFFIRVTGSQTYGHTYWSDIDWVKVDATFSEAQGNWFALLDCDFLNPADPKHIPRFKALSGCVAWDIEAYDFHGWGTNANAIFREKCNAEVNLTADAFGAGTLTYLRVFGLLVPYYKCGGDFIHVSFVSRTYTNTTDSLYFVFHINNTLFEIGTIQPSDFHGVRIDGVHIADIGSAQAFRNRITVEIRDGVLRVEYASIAVDGSASGVQLLHEEADFLGGGPYVVTPGHVYNSNHLSYFMQLWLMGDYMLGADVTGVSTLPISQSQYHSYGRLAPPTAAIPGYFFHCIAVSGGTPGALDNIDPGNLFDTGKELNTVSSAWVIESDNTMHIYRARDDGPVTEVLPDIVVPDTNPGIWYWQRIALPVFGAAEQLHYPAGLTDSSLASFDYKHLYSRLFSLVKTNSNTFEPVTVEVDAHGGGIRGVGLAARGLENRPMTITVIPYNPIKV